jgi:hypothetical protein
LRAGDMTTIIPKKRWLKNLLQEQTIILHGTTR